MRMNGTMIAAAAGVVAMAGTALGQAVLLELPPAPDTAFDRPSTILVSGDGQSFATLFADDDTGNFRAYRWSPVDGYTRLQDAASGTSTEDTRIVHMSDDGRIIVGRGRGFAGRVGVRWIDSTSPTTVADCAVTSVVHASADGTMFVGEGGGTCSGLFATAYRWVEGSGFQALGRLPGWSGYSISNGISADGSVVVGLSGNSGANVTVPFIWTEAEAIQPLQLPIGYLNGVGRRSTNDARIVFGDVWPTPPEATTHRRIVRWIDGAPQLLENLDGAPVATAIDMTHNGEMVVGWVVRSDGTEVAIVWTEATGMISAEEYFAGFGLDLTGWEFTNVSRVSALGDVFAGRGIRDGQLRHWVVDLSAAFPPVIDLQPAATTLVDAGQSVELSVGLRLGTPPIDYQWRRNGEPLSDTGPYFGTTTDTLRIDPARPGQTDVYDVVVTNAFGQATSTQSLVAVREGCRADFDGDGQLTIFDFLAFQNAFAIGCP